MYLLIDPTICGIATLVKFPLSRLKNIISRQFTIIWSQIISFIKALEMSINPVIKVIDKTLISKLYNSLACRNIRLNVDEIQCLITTPL